jgi:hypothetical protein
MKGLFKPTNKPAGSSTDQGTGTQDAASKLKGLFEKKK